jgi:hypothetical protein
MPFYYLKIQVPEEVRITEEVRMMGKGSEQRPGALAPRPASAAKSLSAAPPAVFYGFVSF